MSPQQAPDWATYSADLPQNLPDEAYDALRDRYFNEQIAPTILKAGYGLDTARKQFLEKTQRPGKTNYPRSALVGKAALESLAAPFASGQPELQRGMQEQVGEAAQVAQRQGVEPEGYAMGGAMLGQAPYWMAGLGAAGEVAGLMKAGPLLEKAIKTAAGGLIQGSYDLLKTGNAIEGLKGAASGAGIVAGFEAIGGLHGWLTGKGMEPSSAKAVEAVAKGTASPEQHQLAVDATLSHGNLDKDIQEFATQQLKSSQEAGVPAAIISPPSYKGLQIKMTGADGQPYVLKSPANINAAIGRIVDHLQAGGKLDEVTGDPKAVANFYQAFQTANESTFDLFAKVNGVGAESSQATMPLGRVSTIDLKAATDLNKLINSRNSYYHATDLEGFRGILESGQIAPSLFDSPLLKDTKAGYTVHSPETGESWHYDIEDEALAKAVEVKGDLFHLPTDMAGIEGVSVSRTPRLASKADKAITFVIDAEKMPKTRPYVEEGYGKGFESTYANELDAGVTDLSYPDWVEKQKQYLWFNEAGRNPHFEFEQRTFNEPVPLSAVRGVIVDRAALESIYYDPSEGLLPGEGSSEGAERDTADIIQLAKQHNIPVKFMGFGQDVHSYRAGLGKLPPEQRWGMDLTRRSLLKGMGAAALNPEELAAKLTQVEGTLKGAEAGNKIAADLLSNLLNESLGAKVSGFGKGYVKLNYEGRTIYRTPSVIKWAVENTANGEENVKVGLAGMLEDLGRLPAEAKQATIAELKALDDSELYDLNNEIYRAADTGGVDDIGKAAEVLSKHVENADSRIAAFEEQRSELYRKANADRLQADEKRYAEKDRLEREQQSARVESQLRPTGRELTRTHLELPGGGLLHRYAMDIPLYDQLESLPTGQVRNKLTGEVFDNMQSALTQKSSQLHKLISARDSYYHATDLEGFRGILEKGQIHTEGPDVPDFLVEDQAEKLAQLHPEWDEDQLTEAALQLYDSSKGVSVSRTPRVASKAEKAITLVLDAKKMPETRPYVEEGYGKEAVRRDLKTDMTPEEEADFSRLAIRVGSNSPEGLRWSQPLRAEEQARYDDYLSRRQILTSQERNPHFEFEQRTFNKPISIDAVKGILVDESALFDRASHTSVGYGVETQKQWQEIQQLAQQHNIPVKIFDNGKDLHSYRAGLAKQPEDMRWASGEPGQSRTDISYKETPLSHRYSGQIPEEIMPEGAQAGSIGAGQGEKPSTYYRDQSKELIFHENLHGHFSYLGIQNWLNSTFYSDPIVHEIFNGAFPEEAQALYRGEANALPEEVFSYAASAVRTGNEQLLQRFADADTDMETVLKWTSDTSQKILNRAAYADDSLHKRVLERRLTSVIARSTEKLSDINKPYATSPLSLDLTQNQYAVREGTTTHYFSDRTSALNHLESQYEEPLQAPELIPLLNLPDGVPRFALKVPAPSSDKPPLTSDPLPPELTPKPLKAGTSVFSFFYRPFYDWLSDVARKFQRPELYSAFSQIDDQIKHYNNAIRPYLNSIKDTVGQHSQERQTDFFKWMQQADEHKPFVEKELSFTAEELSHLQQFREQASQLGGDFEDYLQKDLPRLQSSSVEEVFPAGKDKSLIGDLVRRGTIDPADTNLIRVFTTFLRKQMHSDIVEPAIKEAETLVDAKIGGKYDLGQLQPLLHRRIAFMRGQTDFTERAVNGLMEATINSINEGIESVNKHLPDNLQLPQIEAAPRDILQKALMYQYAGTLGAKPGVLFRASLQSFITSFPLAGNYIWKGMGRAFEVAKERGESDAWQIAQRYGAFIDKAGLTELIAGGGDEVTGLADKSLRMIQWSHNSSRLVSFWAHSEKALDALYKYHSSGDLEQLVKESDLWFMPKEMRAKYLKELEHFSVDNAEDLSRRIGASLTDLIQWNYRKGGQPGMYQWQLGRIFGQYGTWPLNYIEYGRRLVQGSDKTAMMQALTRLAIAHGSIIAAGTSVGADTSGWVFLSPMAYGGGPVLQAITSIPTAATDWSTSRGSEARNAVTNLINPIHYFPGYDQAHQIWKATAENDPNIWLHVMGFKPDKD